MGSACSQPHSECAFSATQPLADRKCKLALDTISREKRKRQDGHGYTPRGQVLPETGPEEGARGRGGPEEMPMPQLLLCDSCKQYHPIESMSEDPAVPGVLRCIPCRTALAAYSQQQLDEQQQAIHEVISVPLLRRCTC